MSAYPEEAAVTPLSNETVCGACGRKDCGVKDVSQEHADKYAHTLGSWGAHYRAAWLSSARRERALEMALGRMRKALERIKEYGAPRESWVAARILAGEQEASAAQPPPEEK